MIEEYGFDGTLNSTAPIGLVPDGLRLDISFSGTMVTGQLQGSITGTDYALIRRDGIGVLDVRELITLADGGAVEVRAAGYVVPPFPMPPLEVLAAPDFAWPDADLPMHGTATMRTGVAELAELNHTAFGWTGSVNVATGALRVRARSLLAAHAMT